MSHYSAFSIFKNALTGNRHWQKAWCDPHPKPAYDVIIVGAGGHGLATAYYLAKEHGIHRVGVLIHRTSEARFEIFTPVTWARSVWELLCLNATPFGYSVEVAA